MLPNSSADLLIILAVIITLTLDELSALSCVKTGPCTCRFPGKGLVDLRPIETSTLLPKFSAIAGKDQNLYFYNPCNDFNLKNVVNCTDAAGCVYDTKSRIYTNLGSVESAQFITDEKEKVTIVYNRVTAEGVLTTKVHLLCSKLESPQLLPQGATQNGTVYDVTLSAKCACVNGCLTSHGLSAGSILLIIGAVLVIMYIGVGSCYNYALGARGKYALPHHEFWSDFPTLVRDGYWFFLSPCIGDSPEYRYYERL